MPVDHRPDTRGEFSDGPWFCEGLRVVTVRPDNIVGRISRGKKEGNVASGFPDAAEQSSSVQTGHGQIGDDQGDVGRLGFE